MNIIKDYFFLNKLENHVNIKNQLIDMILQADGEMQNSGGSTIEKTDFQVANKQRMYANFFVSEIEHLMLLLQNKMLAQGWNINPLWYQIYNKNHHHTWHNHCNSNFANIYYVQLPDKSSITEFYDIVNKKVFKLEVTEGELITFPAFFLHRSPPNKSDKSKIIISFNSNFPTDNVDIKLINI
jgi:hypothetical protein